MILGLVDVQEVFLTVLFLALESCHTLDALARLFDHKTAIFFPRDELCYPRLEIIIFESVEFEELSP